MRIGLFGGSFDPPHTGHLAVARAAAEAFGLEMVLFAPVGLQPLKPVGAVASFTDRLRMVELLCKGEAGFRASAVDGPREDGRPNYTVETLLRLRDELRVGDEVFVLVGVDAFLEVTLWREWRRLFELARWVVVSRPGFAAEALEGLGFSEAERSRVEWLGGVEEEVSATAVRACLRGGGDCSGMLTAGVYGYIREHGLYR